MSCIFCCVAVLSAALLWRKVRTLAIAKYMQDYFGFVLPLTYVLYILLCRGIVRGLTLEKGPDFSDRQVYARLFRLCLAFDICLVYSVVSRYCPRPYFGERSGL